MGNLNRRNVLQLGLGALSLPWAQGALADDAWPSKPIKIIVSVPPGGPADAVCRLVAKQMESRLRQPVIVDNKPGAAGIADQLGRRFPASHGRTCWEPLQNI